MKRKKERLTVHPCFLILTCAIQVLYGVISMYAAVLINAVANTVSVTTSLAQLLRVGVPAIGFAVVYAGFRALSSGMTQLYAERVSQTLRSRLNRVVFSMDCAAFTERDSGEYLNLMVGDVRIVRDQYNSQIPLLFCYVAQFVFCVAYSIFLNPVVAAIMIVMSGIQYIVPLFWGKKINKMTVVQSRESARFTSKAKELLFGFSIIKTYRAQRKMQEDFDRSNQDMARACEKAAVMTHVMMSVNMMIAWMMILTSVIVAGCFVIQGEMQAGAILTVFYIANRYSMPVTDFVDAYTKIKGSRGVREKLNRFFDSHAVLETPPIYRIHSTIAVSNLYFSYGADSTPVLRDVSFTFQKGKKYLILGESGCGKSTLLKVIAGQYQAKGVLVDGVPVENLPSDALAGTIVLVGQQPYVFQRSIAENIDLLHSGDRARLTKVARQCCIDDFISSLPEGIDTQVDEEQRRLSGGQKARIELARALYARPDVLLLDEVTGALDPDTAFRIEKMLLTLSEIMVIHIAHKPAYELRKEYDAILTMQAGRIAEISYPS